MTATQFNDTEAFRVEQRGIDFVSSEERWASPRDIAGLWAGVSTNVQYFVYGAILPVFGLPLWTAIAVVLIGNLSYLLLAVASLQGPVAGTTTFTISRASFGVRGSRVMSFSNWITQLGFETEGLLLIVGAVVTLFTMAGVSVTDPMKIAVIIAATTIMVVLPLFGHATMVKVLRWLIAPFVAAYAVLTFFISGHVNTAVVNGQANDWQTLSLALAFSFTLAGLSWTENGNDYTRYLPANARRSAIVGWLFAATAIPQVLTMLVGFFTVAAFPIGPDWLSANPFDAFLTSHHATAQGVVPAWFVVIFLLMAITQLFAINSLDLYSSGVSLQAMGLRLRRYQAVLLDGVIAGTLTTWVTFASTFADFMRTFVGVVIIWITPWLAIYLTDWMLRRRRYDVDALHDTSPDGRYFGHYGVNWNAVSAMLVGMSLALAAYAKPLGSVNFPTKWMSPLTGHFGWYETTSGQWGGLVDFSIPLGFVSAALVYFLLDRDSGYIQAQESGQARTIVATTAPRFATVLAALWTLTQILEPSAVGKIVGVTIGVALTLLLGFVGRHTNAGRDVVSTAGVVSLIITSGSVSYHAGGRWWIPSLALAVALVLSRWLVPSTKPR